MHVLYLAQRVPYPPNRGDKIITFHQVRHLARKHTVTVACLVQDDDDFAHAQALSTLVHRVRAVRLSPAHARMRALGAVATGRPFTLGYFNEPELRRAVDEVLERDSVDAIVVFCSGMAQFVERAAGWPRLIHFVDLDSLKWEQYARSAAVPQRWLYARESRRLLEYERHLVRTFDQAFVCTDDELYDLRRLIPAENVSALPNGIDLDYFAPPGGERQKNALIFTGVMDYKPNADGAVWFAHHVLPRLRQQLPDVLLTICGARPEPRVRRLAAIPGVIVTGGVPDVRPYLGRASVAVVPLHIARGIQNKVLEAMATGLPVVATSKAFGGTRAVRDCEILVADDAEEFAGQVLRLLRDDGLRAQIGRAARARIEKDYDWEVPLSRFEGVLESLARPQQLISQSVT